MFNHGAAFLHYVLYRVGLHRPESQTTEKERQVIADFAASKLHAVEIGVFEGLTTRLIAEKLADDGTLYAIDPFFSGRLGICYAEKIARRYVRYISESKIRFIKALSHDALDQAPEALDFVFIDGDHSLEGIRRDWNDWSGRVVPGGIIALHDTCVPEHNPSVADLGSFHYFQSTIRFDERFELLKQVESLSVLRRK